MQIFHRSANVISRASIYAGIFTLAFVLWACIQFQRSPYVTYAGVVRPQPAPFSHQHHVAALGIDCRYCHTSVETSSFAGIPPTKTCMNCHSQIWTNAKLLEPVRASYKSGESLQWTRVNQLPDFVFFNHSIHVNKGVGCNTCHGPVDQMPLMYQQPTSANPVVVDGQSYTDQQDLGTALVKKYRVRSVKDITTCSTCHR